MIGDALLSDLSRRFVTAAERVQVGSESIELVKPGNFDDLVSEEDFARDDRLPYWCDVWPSSLILGAALLERQGAGRRLVELGCGLGLVTICAMRAGFDVLATDYYDDALRFTRANAWRALAREPETRLVDWRVVPADLGAFECVVAADVLYEAVHAELVAEVLARTVADGGEALIADPGRPAVPSFIEACAERRMLVAAQKTHPFVAGDIRQQVTVYSIRRAPEG
ncbi:MAG: methyltransferase domain-containing protein [Gemmatimonadota bacterium]|nr:methyltransferase domain-containing protein [Gemmatimonadota bacterium]